MSKIASLIVFFLLLPHSDAFFRWLFSGRSSGNGDDTAVSAPIPRAAVPFEMKTVDEKFLMQANTGKELSELDFCHHRVIIRLTSSCGDLTEEELGKLSVALLNCQLHAEERETFFCTEDMSIAECTKEMDGTMWNAYQIVSNRARAICYSTRQQQFRMKTEHTVNTLVHTTEEQLEAMRDIERGQEQIRGATVDTLQKMALGQNELMTKQRALRNTQISLQTSLASSLQDLIREKAQISAGNQHIAEMTSAIKDKLDSATAQMSEHEQIQKENQKEILDDLAEIRTRAHDVWEKIDNSSKNVLQYHNETKQHYEETIENLQKVNNTVTSVVTSVQDLQTSLESKLAWIAQFLGGTKDQVVLLSVIVCHLLYFLLAAISASFLRVPMFSRLFILMLVPVNAWSEITHRKSLDYSTMTMCLVLTAVGNWVVALLWYRHQCRKVKQCANYAIESTSISDIGMTSPYSPYGCTAQSPDANMTQGDHDNPELRKMTTPDLKRLAELLETMCHTKSDSMVDTSTVKEENSEFNKKVEDVVDKKKDWEADAPKAESGIDDDDEDEEEEERDEEKDGDGDEGWMAPEDLPPPTPMPEDEACSFNASISAPLGSVKNRADMVKRRLLSSPLPSDMSPLTNRSRTSTPRSSPARGSRNSSLTRTLCNALTKTGQPCRNVQKEGSEFCYRHNSHNGSMNLTPNTSRSQHQIEAA